MLLIAPWAAAQKMVTARAGMVYYAEGRLLVDGQVVRAGSRDQRPMIADGQRVATPRGHAEILLGPDAVLWTGTGAEVQLADTNVENATLRLVTGSAMIEIRKHLTENSVQVELPGRAVVLRRAGVYRFDAAPETVRVWSGEALLPGSAAAKVPRGNELVDGQLRRFDRTDRDELHYWAAYRSFQLEQESGASQQWQTRGWANRAHSGFNVEFPETAGSARVKYMAGGAAGLVYSIEGNASLDGPVTPATTRLPFWLGESHALRTEAGRAEIFLGVGVVARLGEHSRLRLIHARPTAPFIVLEAGAASIEVTPSPEAPRLRVRVGPSITELLKPGVYQFDAGEGSLRVYGGEAATVFEEGTVRARQAQQVSLREMGPADRFDVTVRDALFLWAADRSFALYLSPAAFMTQWERTPRGTEAKHKQFGARIDRRPLPAAARRLPRL
jgi:hypothetical protein